MKFLHYYSKNQCAPNNATTIPLEHPSVTKDDSKPFSNLDSSYSQSKNKQKKAPSTETPVMSAIAKFKLE
jgi:hypothetical protein